MNFLGIRMCRHQTDQARRHYACLTTPNVGLVERKCPYGAPLPQTLGCAATFIDPLSIEPDNVVYKHVLEAYVCHFFSFLMQRFVFIPNHAEWEISFWPSGRSGQSRRPRCHNPSLNCLHQRSPKNGGLFDCETSGSFNKNQSIQSPFADMILN